MTDNYMVDGQMSLTDLDPDSWFGKTSLAACQVQEKETQEKTSKRSSQKSQGSQSQNAPMCLCLKVENGHTPESSMEWVTMDNPFPWLGNYTTLSGGAYHKDAGELVLSQTSTDSLPERYCLTLNIGEKPRVPNPTHLSEILEEDANPKYHLSAKACRGILKRANKRGKQLPPILKEALENQIGAESNE